MQRLGKQTNFSALENIQGNTHHNNNQKRNENLISVIQFKSVEVLVLSENQKIQLKTLDEMYFLGITWKKTEVASTQAQKQQQLAIIIGLCLTKVSRNRIHIFKITYSFMYPQQIFPRWNKRDILTYDADFNWDTEI